MPQRPKQDPNAVAQAEKNPYDVGAANAQGMTMAEWVAQYPTASAQAKAAGTSQWPPASGRTADTVPKSDLSGPWAQQVKDDATAKATESNIEAMSKAVAALVQPDIAETQAAPFAYADVMGKLNALPGGDMPGGSTAVSQADEKVTQDLQAGEKGIETALGRVGPAVNQAITDLPYADILNATLTQKKNQILYGTSAATTYQVPKEAGWSDAMKGIYSYLAGSPGQSGGSPVPSAGPLSADVLAGAAGGGGSTTTPGTSASNPTGF